jgi:hypothetical protein
MPFTKKNWEDKPIIKFNNVVGKNKLRFYLKYKGKETINVVEGDSEVDATLKALSVLANKLK